MTDAGVEGIVERGANWVSGDDYGGVDVSHIHMCKRV